MDGQKKHASSSQGHHPHEIGLRPHDAKVSTVISTDERMLLLSWRPATGERLQIIETSGQRLEVKLSSGLPTFTDDVHVMYRVFPVHLLLCFVLFTPGFKCQSQSVQSQHM